MPQPPYPMQRVPGTHGIGGWLDLQASHDTREDKGVLSLPGIEHPFIVQPEVQPLY